jgi:hypothetical protein
VFGPWGRGWDGRPAPPRSVTHPLSPWVKGGWGTTGRGGRTTLESSKVKISKGWGACFMDSHPDAGCSLWVRLLSLDVYGGDEAGQALRAGGENGAGKVVPHARSSRCRIRFCL